MSKNKHAYRVMVIDIEEDKIVIDEFCDAIVAGVATNGGSPEETKGTELLASKSDLFAGIFKKGGYPDAYFERMFEGGLK